MVTCPDCEATMSEHAAQCPKCGHPNFTDVLPEVFSIPAIPKDVFDSLKVAQSSDPFLIWKARVGDVVTKGQEIAEYQVQRFTAFHRSAGRIKTKATIMAPVSGRLWKINGATEFCEWNTEAERWTPGSACMLFEVRPHGKVVYVTGYEAYEHIIDFGYFVNNVCRGYDPKQGLLEAMAEEAILRVTGRTDIRPLQLRYNDPDLQFSPGALEQLANYQVHARHA